MKQGLLLFSLIIIILNAGCKYAKECCDGGQSISSYGCDFLGFSGNCSDGSNINLNSQCDLPHKVQVRWRKKGEKNWQSDTPSLDGSGFVNYKILNLEESTEYKIQFRVKRTGLSSWKKVIEVAASTTKCKESSGVTQDTQTHPSLIYAVKDNGDMLLYKHNKLTEWGFDATPKKIGNGWHFKQIAVAGFGYIYAIKDNGDMLLYKHDGDGSNWSINARKIGNGWHFKHVFAGTDGRIYAIKDDGDMLLYKHDGSDWVLDATQIGNGWDFKHVFAGTDGRIYAIRDSGDMLLYKHNDDGVDWSIDALLIGTGWYFKHVFAGNDGHIYAVKDNGDMLLYKHDGDGVDWSVDALLIGNGWNFKQIDARYQ